MENAKKIEVINTGSRTFGGYSFFLSYIKLNGKNIKGSKRAGYFLEKVLKMNEFYGIEETEFINNLEFFYIKHKFWVSKDTIFQAFHKSLKEEFFEHKIKRIFEEFFSSKNEMREAIGANMRDTPPHKILKIADFINLKNGEPTQLADYFVFCLKRKNNKLFHHTDDGIKNFDKLKIKTKLNIWFNILLDYSNLTLHCVNL